METSAPVARSRFRRHMVPTTSVGWFCLASFAVGALGFIAMVVSVGSGQEGGGTFTDNWWISGPALGAVLGIVVALATGLFAIIGRRERAVPGLPGHGDRGDRDALLDR